MTGGYESYYDEQYYTSTNQNGGEDSNPWNFDDYIVFYIKQEKMPKPRRITKTLIVTTPRNNKNTNNVRVKPMPTGSSPEKSISVQYSQGGTSSAHKRQSLFTERVMPKNQRIGTQIDTLDENVMESQVSLFDEDEDNDSLE